MEKIKIRIRLKLLSFYIIKLFIFNNIFSFSKCECDRDTPIIKNEECTLVYCTETEFNNNICKIDNKIVKTQWLNNLIIFDDNKYRYCNFAINSKGDMIAEYSTEEANGIRLFYGLKKNGNFYFKNSNNSEISTTNITVKDGNTSPTRYEATNIFISLNNTDSTDEYLISFSLYHGYTELFDFESNRHSFVKTEDMTGYVIHSTRNQLIEIKNNISKDIKYLHIFVGQKKNNLSYQNFYVVLYEYTFLSNTISYENGYIISNELIINNAYGSRIVSGYKTDCMIVLFFFTKEKKIKINIYDFDLNEKNTKEISSIKNINNNIGFFFKSIYLKNNLGAFIYFKDTNDYGPELKILDIDDNYNITEKFNISLVTENRFISEPMVNDLIKINDNRFCFITSSYNKKQLFILLFDFFNSDNNIKARIYKFYLYDLYNYKINTEISSILYNNYITISLSVYENSNSFSFLIIFNYINGTDKFIDLYPFLKENKIGNNDLVSKLLENTQIDNNIFGYELLREIKLITIPNELIIYNKLPGGQRQILKENDILLSGHEIEQNKNIMKTNDIYFIEYQFIVKEPPYERFNQFPIQIIDFPNLVNKTNDQDKEYVENRFYSRINIIKFKLCNEFCETCNYLGSPTEHNCIAYTDIVNTDSDNYVESTTVEEGTTKTDEEDTTKTDEEDTTKTDEEDTTKTDEEDTTKTDEGKKETDNIKTENININDDKCNDNSKFYIDKNSKEKICLKKEDECPLTYPFFNQTNNQCMESVSFEDLLKINFTSYTSEEENQILYNLFKNNIIETYSGNENLIVTTQDSNVFQLTNSLNELNAKNGKSSNGYNLSMIDLGECGIKLKKKYNINDDTPLIIFKLEKAGEVASKRNIQYEVYNPNTKKKMDLSICDDEKVNIYIPVTLSDGTQELRSDLLNYGYDLFNSNDIFYQDICTPYTSVNGTDVLLSDRRDYFFNDSETSCQEGCEYSGYSSENKHLKCECSVNNEEIKTEKVDEKFDQKIIFNSFYDVIKYSNYKVLKCYKLVFNLEIFNYNYGSYVFFVYFIFYAFFNIFFFIKGFYYVKVYAAKILYNNNAVNNSNIKLDKRKSRKSILNIYNPNMQSPPKKTKIINSECSKSEKSICVNHNNDDKEIKILKRSKTKGRKSVMILNRNKPSSNSLEISSNQLKSRKKSIAQNKILFNKKSEYNIYKLPQNNEFEKPEKKEKRNIFSYFKGNNFSDYELNELEYLEAIKYDKRSYFRYYWSLIRREHLIVFTFFSYHDYNILSIKLSKFVFALATDFALNVVFFFDQTMSKIYLDYGSYNFIAQIPQALYSTIVSESLDVLLRYLCLTEKDMYRIKKIEKKKKKKSMSNDIFKILRCIKIKLIVYFIITHILLFFFWYFVSAFCAVYRNTQIHLFKDSFVSLFLSLLYPFGLYILPTSLRIIALRDSKKGLKVLYKVSDIIPLI